MESSSDEKCGHPLCDINASSTCHRCDKWLCDVHTKVSLIPEYPNLPVSLCYLCYLNSNNKINSDNERVYGSLLLHNQIINEYHNDRIRIAPFNFKQVGPNSYDVTLSPLLKIYTNDVLDMKIQNPTKTIVIPEEGLVLEPNELYLGSTNEAIGSDYYIPGFEGRSSVARLGIQGHISAGFGDIGFKSNWTLEITVVKPTRVYPNVKIGQVFFNVVDQKFNTVENRYNGKYVDQKEPQESKIYLDFK